MTTHSKIGASSMKRWAACPGSVKLSEGVESRSSEFAAEGTMAHAVAEAWLNGDEPQSGDLFKWDDHGKACQAILDDTMIEHVGVYLDAVHERCDGKRENLLVEQKFHLKDLHEDLFGTSDAIVWQPAARRLSVIDLKYGAGVPVEVRDNPQLLYYGLGALLANPQWKPAEVEVVIVQPRCPHEDGPVRSHVVPVVDLIDFAGELVDAVKRVEQATREFQADLDQWELEFLSPGDHCRWCPAAGLPCPSIAQRAQQEAKIAFAPGLPYEAATLAQTLEWLPILEAWIKNVREFAYAEAEKGHDIPRHKLVEKRATRKWRDESEAEEQLIELSEGFALFTRDDLYERKFISPAAVEKMLPKDKRGALEQLCIKESSGHTLVHESDKRDAVKIDAKSAFQGK